jgi:hypothetical protein
MNINYIQRSVHWIVYSFVHYTEIISTGLYRKTWEGDGVVGIATRYGLDGPGIESPWGRNFLHLSIATLGSTQPRVKWVLGLFPGVKRPECCGDHPNLASSLKKR